MSIKDKEKWNEKYTKTPTLLKDRPQSNKLVDVLKYTKGNKALDVACGAGRNSIFLAKNDFLVDSIDISKVALKALDDKNISNIHTKIVDLDNFEIEQNKYDLIIMTNFLDRKIIPKLKKALKENGILFIETYMNHKENEKTPSNPDFLLEKNELKSFSDDSMEIIEYDEFLNEDFEKFKMGKQLIIMKKI